MKEAEAKRECRMRVISLAERRSLLGFYMDKLALLFIFLYTSYIQLSLFCYYGYKIYWFCYIL